MSIYVCKSPCQELWMRRLKQPHSKKQAHAADYAEKNANHSSMLTSSHHHHNYKTLASMCAVSPREPDEEVEAI